MNTEFEIINGELTRYNGKGGDVVIPEGVTVIKTGAFLAENGVLEITSLTLPPTLKIIEDYALKPNRDITEQDEFYMEKVTELHIPSSVEYIGEFNFSKMRNLEKLTLEEGLKHIGTGAFYESINKVKELEIPQTVKTIESLAFTGRARLDKLVINERVKEIHDFAFHVDYIKETALPEGVDKFYPHIFGACHIDKLSLYSNVPYDNEQGSLHLAKIKEIKLIDKGITIKSDSHIPESTLAFIELFAREDIGTKILKKHNNGKLHKCAELLVNIERNSDLISEFSLNVASVADLDTLYLLKEKELKDISKIRKYLSSITKTASKN